MEDLYQRVVELETRQEMMATSINRIERRREADNTLLQEMHQDLKTVKDVVVAWNNMQGFVRTIRAVSSFVLVFVKIAGFISALVLAIYLFGKTGTWMWPNK